MTLPIQGEPVFTGLRCFFVVRDQLCKIERHAGLPERVGLVPPLWNAPWIFHYVNVGPSVREGEAITDVYMPLR